MTRKFLKPSIEKILTYIAIIQIIVLLTLSDFNLKSIPILVIHIILTAMNIYVLYNYSRRINIDNE